MFEHACLCIWFIVMSGSELKLNRFEVQLENDFENLEGKKKNFFSSLSLCSDVMGFWRNGLTEPHGRTLACSFSSPSDAMVPLVIVFSSPKS